jgi:cobalt-precorrin 5A hydrolase
MIGPRPIAVHAITPGGVRIAASLAAALGAEIRVAERLLPLAPAGAVGFALPMREALAGSFDCYRGHVFVMAVGAIVRMLAPFISSKWKDPAVVCVDEAGRFAVSVLSGHAGGGNRLAQEVAQALGAQAVVTTASDALGTLQVDLLGQELGWTVEQPSPQATRASAAVVEGKPVLLVQEVGERDFWPADRPWPAHVAHGTSLQAHAAAQFEALLLVTDRLPGDGEGDLFASAVVYRPRSLVLGIGCDRGAPPGLVARGVESLLARHRLALASVREIATIDLKADEPALRELAARLGCGLRLFAAAELDAAPGIESPSEAVRRHVGARAVAEPAALLASGAARLLLPKQKYTEPCAGRSMTLAIARIPFESRAKRCKSTPAAGGRGDSSDGAKAGFAGGAKASFAGPERNESPSTTLETRSTEHV